MKRALQLLGGTVLGLALAEGVFWVADEGAFPHINVYEPDATLGARLRPGATQKVAFGGNPVTSVRINAEGYRGADWGPAQDGEIVVLGDSQVFGLGVEEDQTASAVLATSTGRPVRNAGIPTHGPPEYLAVLDELLVARKPKSVVLVLNFSNDLFEVNTPNTERHAIWDGWAVRLETMPAEVTNFPGRQWLFSRSHLVHAIRRAWWTPPEAWDQGVPSEGTWTRVLGLASDRPAPDATTTEAAIATEVTQAAQSRAEAEYDLLYLYKRVFPELLVGDKDLVVDAVVQHAQPGDIVGEVYAEEGRSITVTAAQLREGARIRQELEGRLAKWAEEHPRDSKVEQIRAVLDGKTELDGQLQALATRVAEEVQGRSPLLDVVAAAKARCDAAGAELVVVALPLDVQVSDAEWAKYGAEPQDMTATRILLEDLTRGAERLGVRALDATAALGAAQPGAFLNADLHMSPKGQAALGAALAVKLAEPAPFATPGPGLPAGRTRVPHPAEFEVAPEVVVRGSTRNRCSTRQLREWLLVDCTRQEGGPIIPEGVVVRKGEEVLTGGQAGGRTRLVTPLVPGREVIADFRWAATSERLTIAWEGETPKMAFAPVEPPTIERWACAQRDAAVGRALWEGYVAPDRGCVASFPSDCAAQLRCAAGTREALPTCPEGQANAGSAGHCHDLCDTTRPCASGTCVDWQGAGVCL